MSNNDFSKLLYKASQSKSDIDYDTFFNSIKGKEVYFSFSNPGEVKDLNSDMTVPLVKVGDGLSAVVLYLSSEDRRLSKKFAGLQWEKALQMVLKMPGANGVVVQDKNEYWIAIARSKIEELLLAKTPH